MNEEDEAFNELERRLNALRDHPEYYKPIAKHAAMPPQREWVGLTDSEVVEIIKHCATERQVASSIQAELKRRNT
jgi:hypothetical protein